jgi:branched-chain amino acid transport system ATP-binding protein
MLLELKKLTMRFGGLTAVDGVDCTVERGEIMSIIGPNGAGKTTVFNAITGIYEPTSGKIKFEGRDLRRPLRLRVWLACGLIGLTTGLFAALCALGPDKLWLATIKRNYTSKDSHFTWKAAATSALAFWRGDLAIQPSYGRRWEVVSADGEIEFGDLKTRAEAETLHDKLKVETSAASEPKLRAATAAAAARRRTTWGALTLGIVIGAAGSFAVWRRSRRSPDVIALAGIARTFQNIRLFKNMTVLENILVAMDRNFRADPIRMALRTRSVRREERVAEHTATELLDFVNLGAKTNALAGSLPYGDQRRLEIARALATQPRLILLDEPAAGMNPSESADLTQLIERIRQRGVTVLLIEHHMKLVMGISDRITVLDYGRKIAEGTPEAVRTNPAVIKAYLGDEEIG